MKALVLKFEGRASPYVSDDLADGLNAMGHQAILLDFRQFDELDKVEQALEVISDIRAAVSQFYPDAVFAYGLNSFFSFVRPDGVKTDLFNFLGVPQVCLFYDAPTDPRVFDIGYRTYNPKNNYFLIWDQFYVDEMKKYGFENSFYMPIASNIRRFKKLQYNEEDAERFSADVSFVGSYTYKRELILTPLLDNFNLAVWGYEWEKARDARFKNCVRGVADNETELVKVYNYSKVNINVTVDQGIGSLNMRVFDCMASGGFLISDDKADFDTLFDKKNEVVTYKYAKELPGLVRYYLDHEDERMELARR
ncbi:MAG TPA: DUF3880 domain-containing protein, partial [bacterium]|nr:DUF3880 domain-containing protein [bacterium]